MSLPSRKADTIQSSANFTAALTRLVQANQTLQPANDLMGRGFSLSYFIFPERAIAIEILTSALNKLKAKCAQERKREYWRDKFLKRQIARVTREEEDALQWLIYLESDTHEKKEEALGRVCGDDLVVRYVKTLARLSTRMSSFYVNIAVHRLLYRYTTLEAQKIYEFVTDTYRGGDEYRRAKRWLTLRLDQRFQGLLHSVKGELGETRFESAEKQDPWVLLVGECLQQFTPWSTVDKCPLKIASDRSHEDLHELLNSHFHALGNQDKIEVNRYHTFIDPICMGHIVRALQLGQHSSRLGVPRFRMNSDSGRNTPSSRLPQSPLTAEERQNIADRLSEEQARRKGTVVRVCTFVVDGIERARMKMDGIRECQFDIPGGSQLFEVWTDDSRGPLLLATHFLKLTESDGLERFDMALHGSISLAFTLARNEQIDLETSSVTVKVERGSHKSQSENWQQRFSHVPGVPAYAGILLLCIALAALLTVHKKTVTNDQRQIAALTDKIAQEEATKSTSASGNLIATASCRLTPDDMVARGGSHTETNAVVVPSAPTLIRLDLPIDNVGPRYSALLTRLGGHESKLIETDLLAVHQSHHSEVTVAVPSTLLSPGQYYRIELRAGRPSISRTFTFYTTPQR